MVSFLELCRRVRRCLVLPRRVPRHGELPLRGLVVGRRLSLRVGRSLVLTRRVSHRRCLPVGGRLLLVVETLGWTLLLLLLLVLDRRKCLLLLWCVVLHCWWARHCVARVSRLLVSSRTCVVRRGIRRLRLLSVGRVPLALVSVPRSIARIHWPRRPIGRLHFSRPLLLLLLLLRWRRMMLLLLLLRLML